MSSATGKGASIFITLSCFLCVALVEGRKCVCTSRACKEANIDTCRTKFSCYTELIILNVNGISKENYTNRGCTERATPLLCDTKSWSSNGLPESAKRAKEDSQQESAVPWPKLKCCDSHDYCNRERELNFTSDESDAAGRRVVVVSHENSKVPEEPPNQPALVLPGNSQVFPLMSHHVRPLHLAAILLAIAALLSVVAACYVVTRFLKDNRYSTSQV